MSTNTALIKEINDMMEWCEAKTRNRMSNKSLTKLEQQGYRDAMFAVKSYLAKRRDEIYIVRKCKDCGKVFHALTKKAKYCNECGARRKQEVAGEYMKANKLWEAGTKSRSKSLNEE